MRNGTLQGSVDRLLSDPRFGRAHIHVRDVATNSTVVDIRGSEPGAPASTLKLLTAAAALTVLGAKYAIPTQVIAGPTRSELILVGGGDVTLSRLPAGMDSCYPGAPNLGRLAERVIEGSEPARPKVRGMFRSLLLDDSLFTGPGWHPSWDEEEERIRDGNSSYVSALQVDADRLDPRQLYSPRSDRPTFRAGQAFATALGGITSIKRGKATAGGRVLAETHSQPLFTLVQIALLHSDNALMECLGRLTALHSGGEASFSGVGPAINNALRPHGTLPSDARIEDASGLSPDNAVSSEFLTGLLRDVRIGSGPPQCLYDALPQSGEHATGTLLGRFTGRNSVVGDAVRAKTGFIEGAYTMAGLVRTRLGRDLSFCVFALGELSSNSRDAIDTVVAELFLDSAR